jgi:hypothetical protein
MPEFLLTVEENDANEHFTKHVIQANSRQMVKYYYHKRLKDWGFTDTSYGTHALEGARGLVTDIHEIERLDRHEYEILSDYLSTWDKV